MSTIVQSIAEKTGQDNLASEIFPISTEAFIAERVAYWRGQGRENLSLGLLDLARRCEAFASDWEFGTTAAAEPATESMIARAVAVAAEGPRTDDER